MTLKKLVFSAIAASALFAVSASAQAPASWTKPTTGFQVIGNIYYVGTEGISAWLIISSKGHILIDGGMPAAAPLVEANIKALGFKLSDVDLILNSHAHFDHAGAIAQLKKDTGAVVIAAAGDKAALESGKYIGSEDVQLELFKAGNVLPALTAAADEAASDPIIAGFQAVGADAVPMPAIPAMGSVWQFWGVAEAAIINGADPKTTWQKLVDDVTAAIK